jgi:hypothetical protein
MTANVNVTKLLFKRGNTAQNAAYTGINGEITVDTQAKTLRVHDGVTIGGNIVTAGAMASYIPTDPTITSIQANVAAANAAISAITGIDTSLLANAATQQTQINLLNANVTAANALIPNLIAISSNIIPAANVTYSLGSEQFQWRDLWVSNNTIYIGNTPIRVDGSTLLVNGAPVSGGSTYGNANVAAYLPTYTGNIAANIVSPTVPTIGGTASAGEAGITYLSGDLSKWAIFTEGAFTVGVWTDVQPGWTVTDNNGFTDTIAGRGSFGAASFQTTVNNWPAPASGKTYVFTSPGYQLGYTNPVKITVGSNDWRFGTDGGLTFPDTTTQTTAYTGYHNGDMTGSVFADDSTLLVDGVNAIVPNSELAKSVTQVIDSDATINTSENVTTDNAYLSPGDFVADVDPSLGFVIPGLSQRNDTEIEVNLFVDAGEFFQTYLLGLTLGRTVIATYSTASGNQTFTSTISQVFSGAGEQVDPGTGWYRTTGRILGTVPAGYTGLIGINFPVYSTESHTWTFDLYGDLTAPGDITTGTNGGRFVQDCGDGITSIRWINIDENNDAELLRFYTGDPGEESGDAERAQIKLNWQSADQSGLTIKSFDQDSNEEHDWEFRGDGSLTLPASGTITAPDDQEFQLQAKDTNSLLRNEINLNPNNGTYMSVWSEELETSFSADDWDTASWVNVSNSGYALFTGAEDLQDFWTTGIGSFVDSVEVSINGGARVPVIYDGNNDQQYGVELSLFGAVPVSSPTTITSLTFYYQTKSSINIDYDNGQMLLEAQSMNITLETSNDISLQSGGDLTLRSAGQDSVRIYTDNSTHMWEFNNTGSLTLPQEGKIYGIGAGPAGDRGGYVSWAGNTSAGGLGYNTMRLVPDQQGLEDVDTYIILDPEYVDGETVSISIRAGGTQDNSLANLYLGGANSHVKIGSGANPPVTVMSNNNSWFFGNTGNLTLPEGGVIAEGVVTDNPTIELTPANPDDASQKLVIKGGLPPEEPADYHLHLTTGNLEETSIFLGTDNHNVRTTTDGKIQITTPTEGTNVWEFDTSGALTFPDDTVQTTAWTGILPDPTYSGSDQIGFATPAPLNLNNSAEATLLTQLNLINTGGGAGAGSAIDFWTYTSVNDVPQVRLQAVDDGDYSADFAIKIKQNGEGGEGSLTTTWTFGADGTTTFPAGSFIDDSIAFLLGAEDNLIIRSDSGDAEHDWIFDNTGDLTLPGNIQASADLSITVPGSIPSGVANWNGDSLGGWDQNLYTNLATTGGTGTGLTVDVVGGSGYITIDNITINNPGTGYSDGDVITINNENNFPGTFEITVLANGWQFGANANLTLPETGYLRVGSGIVAGFASSPAPVISGFSSISAQNFRFQGNGVNILSAVAGTYSNTNVAAYLTTGVTTANLTATGNVVQQSAYYETYANVTNSGGNLTCNFVNGATFYATLTANVTVNFTNVVATAGRVTGATLIVDQGATAYRVANIQINSGGVQTIKYAGGTPNTGTASNTDIMSFSLISLDGTNWRVLGQISNYG